MPEERLTISRLAGLAGDAERFSSTHAERRERANAVCTLREEARALGVPTDEGEELMRLLVEALERPVADIIADAWRERPELREQVSRKKTGAEAAAGLVALADHSIHWELNPVVELRIGDIPKGELKFHADIQLKLKGVQGVISSASITEFSAGQLASNITIEYTSTPTDGVESETRLLVSLERTLALRDSFDLPEGGIQLSRDS